MLNTLCTPAIVYLVYSITQVIAKIIRQEYTPALIEIIVSVIFALLLNFLCSKNMEVVAWLIIFIPFAFMSIVIGMLLFLFNRDPETGRIFMNPNEDPSLSPEPVDVDTREVVNKLVDDAKTLFSMERTLLTQTTDNPLEKTSKTKNVAEQASPVQDTEEVTESSVDTSKYSVTLTAIPVEYQQYMINPVSKVYNYKGKTHYVFTQENTVVVAESEGFPLTFVIGDKMTNIKPTTSFDKIMKKFTDGSVASLSEDKNTIYLHRPKYNESVHLPVSKKIEVTGGVLDSAGNINEDNADASLEKIPFYFAPVTVTYVLEDNDGVYSLFYYTGSMDDVTTKIKDNTTMINVNGDPKYAFKLNLNITDSSVSTENNEGFISSLKRLFM
jgi:predicted aspartyl protease